MTSSSLSPTATVCRGHLAGSGCHVLSAFLYKRVSSAKSQEMESTFCGMPFMYSKNKRSLRTLPCGTSEVTGAGPDVCPSTSTRDPHEEVAPDAIVLQFDGQQLVG